MKKVFFVIALACMVAICPSCEKSGTENGKENEGGADVSSAVDLGLSVKWASCNLGASKPEELGDYFAWGETSPKDPDKDGFSWDNYKWINGYSYSSLTKYCSNGYNGFSDNKTVLDLKDDAAHVILGGKWRIPTSDEFQELMNTCTWEETTINGINGKKVTGPNGNSIFLPYTGHGSGREVYAGIWGVYWCSDLFIGNELQAFLMDISQRGVTVSSRCAGNTIRPVKGK